MCSNSVYFPLDVNNSRRQEITSDAEKQGEGSDKAVTWMRRRSAQKRNKPQTNQARADMTPHPWKCHAMRWDSDRSAPGCSESGTSDKHELQTATSCLPNKVCFFCTKMPGLFKSIPLTTQSSWKTHSFSIEFQGVKLHWVYLTVTGKCSSCFTGKEVGHEETMWGNLFFHV